MVHRLCGLCADKIEIKDGVLFVNDKNADESLSLVHNYILAETELAKAGKLESPDEDYVHHGPDGYAVMYLK